MKVSDSEITFTYEKRSKHKLKVMIEKTYD